MIFITQLLGSTTFSTIFVGHNEPQLVRESFLLLVTDFFHNNLVYVFNDFNWPVVGISHALDYYIWHDGMPLVCDSFLPTVTDFVHVTEH